MISYRCSLCVCRFVLICLLIFFQIVGSNSNSDEKSDGVRQPQSGNKSSFLPSKSTSHVTGDASTSRPDPEVEHILKDAKELADSSLTFWHAFVASLSVIIVSELGDKTFFIAAIMAMRHSRLTVFLGAITALALMTVLSASLGYATQIIPRKVTYYASTALFFIFGVKMLKEGWYMSPGEGAEEYEEAQEEIKKREEEYSRRKDSTTNEADVEVSMPNSPTRRISRTTWIKNVFQYLLLSTIFMEAFTLTFLAEWGDRSQLATIILAARESVIGVTIGGTMGHFICTGFAVLGGRIVAQRISVRTVTLCGGVVFVLFALSALVLNPE